MATKPQTPPTYLNYDDPQNWDFRSIDPNELRACCLWEYARESSFVRDTLQRLNDWQELSSKGQFDSTKANAIDADLQTIGNCQLSRDVYFPRDLLLAGNPQRFPNPWQSLTKAEKQARLCVCAGPRLKLIGGFRIGSSHDVNDFASAVSRAHRKVKGSAPPFTQIEPRILTRSGNELLLVEIRWGHFSPDTIAQCFRKWVTSKANQPRGITSRTGRPAGTFDSQAALDGLAIMRLLHCWKPTEAEAKAPWLWRQRRGKQLFRTRQGARAAFKKIFPLLPKGERPVSWPTKAGRSR